MAESRGGGGNRVQVALDFVADATGVKSETQSLKSQLHDLAKMGAGFAFGTTLQELGAGLSERLLQGATAIERVGNAARYLQRNIGGTAEEVSAFVSIFDRFNVDVQAGSNSLVFFARAMRGVIDPSESAIESGRSFMGTLGDLGVRTTDSQGNLRDWMAVLLDVSDAFKENRGSVENGINAQILFGRAGRDLLPVLQLGAEGIKELQGDAAKYGLTLSQNNLAAVYEYTQAHKSMDEAMTGVSLTIGKTLLPWMERLADTATGLMQRLNQGLNPALRDLAEAHGGPRGGANTAGPAEAAGQPELKPLDPTAVAVTGAVAVVGLGVALRGLMFALSPFQGIVGGAIGLLSKLTGVTQAGAVAAGEAAAAETAVAVADRAAAAAKGPKALAAGETAVAEAAEGIAAHGAALAEAEMGAAALAATPEIAGLGAASAVAATEEAGAGVAAVAGAGKFGILGGAARMAIGGVEGLGTALVGIVGTTGLVVGGIATLAAAVVALGSYGIWRHTTDELDDYQLALKQLPEAEREAAKAEVERRLVNVPADPTTGIDVAQVRRQLMQDVVREKGFDPKPTVDTVALAAQARAMADIQDIKEGGRPEVVAAKSRDEELTRANYQLGQEMVEAMVHGVDVTKNLALKEWSQMGQVSGLALVEGIREVVTGSSGPNAIIAGELKKMTPAAQEAFRAQTGFMRDQAGTIRGIMGSRERGAQTSDDLVTANRQLADLQAIESAADRRRAEAEGPLQLRQLDLREKAIAIDKETIPLRERAAELDFQAQDYAFKRVDLLNQERVLRAQIAATPANRAMEDLNFNVQRLGLESVLHPEQREDIRMQLTTLGRRQPGLEYEALMANRGVTEVQRPAEDAQQQSKLAALPLQAEKAGYDAVTAAADLRVQQIKDEQQLNQDDIDLMDIRFDRDRMGRAGQLRDTQQNIDLLGVEQRQAEADLLAYSDFFAKSITASGRFTDAEAAEVTKRLGLHESEIQKLHDLQAEYRITQLNAEGRSAPTAEQVSATMAAHPELGPRGAYAAAQAALAPEAAPVSGVAQAAAAGPGHTIVITVPVSVGGDAQPVDAQAMANYIAASARAFVSAGQASSPNTSPRVTPGSP